MNWKLARARRRIWRAGILALVALAATLTVLLPGALPGQAQSNPFTLADFDQSGLQVEVLDLFEASGATTLYSAADSSWVANGSLVEGDVDLRADSQIVWAMVPDSNGSLLRLNDNGPLVLREFFGGSGVGADLTVWLQSASATTSFPASDVKTAGKRLPELQRAGVRTRHSPRHRRGPTAASIPTPRWQYVGRWMCAAQSRCASTRAGAI